MGPWREVQSFGLCPLLLDLDLHLGNKAKLHLGDVTLPCWGGLPALDSFGCGEARAERGAVDFL